MLISYLFVQLHRPLLSLQRRILSPMHSPITTVSSWMMHNHQFWGKVDLREDSVVKRGAVSWNITCTIFVLKRTYLSKTYMSSMITCLSYMLMPYYHTQSSGYGWKPRQMQIMPTTQDHFKSMICRKYFQRMFMYKAYCYNIHDISCLFLRGWVGV